MLSDTAIMQRALALQAATMDKLLLDLQARDAQIGQLDSVRLLLIEERDAWKRTADRSRNSEAELRISIENHLDTNRGLYHQCKALESQVARLQAVVEAARLVDTYTRWVHVGTDKWSGREVPNDDDLEQLSAALKALEAGNAAE